MANDRKPLVSGATKDLNSLLDELLSFGPERDGSQTADFNQRIRTLIDQLEDIGNRIDRLSSKE